VLKLLVIVDFNINFHLLLNHERADSSAESMYTNAAVLSVFLVGMIVVQLQSIVTPVITLHDIMATSSQTVMLGHSAGNTGRVVLLSCRHSVLPQIGLYWPLGYNTSHVWNDVEWQLWSVNFP